MVFVFLTSLTFPHTFPHVFGLGNGRDRGRTDLLERLENVERGLKQLQLDWEVTLDKVYRWMKRSQKRTRDDDGAAAVDDAASATPREAVLHPVVARIMARRLRGRRGVPASVPGGHDGRPGREGEE